MRKTLVRVGVGVGVGVVALALTACTSDGADSATTPAEHDTPTTTAQVADAERAAELKRQIADGDITGPPPVHYRCDDDSKSLTTVFYNDFDPPAAVLTWGADEVVLFSQPMASGIRYTGDGVDYAEHQGEVTVDFRGTQLTCTGP